MQATLRIPTRLMKTIRQNLYCLISEIRQHFSGYTAKPEKSGFTAKPEKSGFTAKPEKSGFTAKPEKSCHFVNLHFAVKS